MYYKIYSMQGQGGAVAYLQRSMDWSPFFQNAIDRLADIKERQPCKHTCPLTLKDSLEEVNNLKWSILQINRS